MSGPFEFEASTPAEAQTKPWVRLRDQQRSTNPEQLATLSEDDLDPPRILVLCELASACRWLHIGELHDATLDLRDRLLRDHEDVALLEPSRALGGFDEASGEIVALLELRNASKPDDAKISTHGRPVISTPA